MWRILFANVSISVIMENDYINGETCVLVKQRVQTNMIIMVIVAVAAILMPAMVPVAPAAAQSNANVLKLSPVRSDIQVEAGTSKTVEVTVSNLTKEPMKVSAIANDFIAGDERGTPALILDADKFAPTHSLKRFMVPLSDVTVAPGENKKVGVVIIVPKDAQPGGYFGAIRFAPASATAGAQVNLNASAASLILLTVPGDTVEKVEMTEFSVQQGGHAASYFQSSNDLQAAFRMQNKGNVQIGPFGKLTVRQGDKVVYDVDFNNKDQRDMILPDSARRWDIPLKNIGSFGHYTVEATFSYGKKNQTIEVKKSFWVIPMIVIIATAVGILLLTLLIIGIWLFLRSYKRRILRSQGRLR